MESVVAQGCDDLAAASQGLERAASSLAVCSRLGKMRLEKSIGTWI
jgi:hypothetical protein